MGCTSIFTWRPIMHSRDLILEIYWSVHPCSTRVPFCCQETHWGSPIWHSRSRAKLHELTCLNVLPFSTHDIRRSSVSISLQKKLRSSKGLSTTRFLLYLEQEAGVWNGVAMMFRPLLWTVDISLPLGEKRKERKKKLEHVLVCAGKKDLLHYPIPQNTIEDLPSISHSWYLEE